MRQILNKLHGPERKKTEFYTSHSLVINLFHELGRSLNLLNPSLSSDCARFNQRACHWIVVFLLMLVRTDNSDKKYVLIIANRNEKSFSHHMFFWKKMLYSLFYLFLFFISFLKHVLCYEVLNQTEDKWRGTVTG